MLESDRIRQLADCLAHDRPVDWDEQERDASTEKERRTIRQMRVLAALGDLHRAVRESDAGSDLSASISIARSVAHSATSTAAASTPEIPSGSRWGHLEILERIGHGGFGDVYRARDTRLDRIVALKLLGPETTASSDEVIREARLLAKVRHPHVVMVHGADRIGGRVGIWMEFLQGETLDRILRARGALDAREAALVGIDLCRALSAVHAAGIVHQDVKLGNVMRAEGGRIVLMDFGLGREAQPSRGKGRPHKISGTPLFMAPEVLRGSAADARSDVYSLGVVLFALVTGALPVEATSVSDLLTKHDRGEIRRARELRADLPEGFAQLLDRALSADVQQRFATPAEVERALLHSLGAAVQSAPEHTRTSAIQRWAFAALGVGLAVAIAFAIRGTRHTSPAPEATRAAPLADLPTATLVGETADDLFGLAVAGPGDVDQDGFDDVLIGAPYHQVGDSVRGKIYLYRGSSTGLESQPSWTAEGTEDGAVFGSALASAKTILAGFPALIVGSPSITKGTGRVSVFAGSKDGPAKQPVQTLSADGRGTLFGFAIATGDVNHDGSDDLLVGEPHYPDGATRSGRAHLYLSKGNGFATEAWTVTGAPGSYFGVALSMGGDVNHDGYADALIGAPTASLGPDLSNCGAAYLYLGSPTGLDSIPTVIPGRQAGSQFGRDVHIAGDLDGDGFSDIIVGAEQGTNGEESEGIVVVHFGSKNGISPYGEVFLEPNNMGSNFGGHAGPLGDLDGDGCDDLFVGALRYQRTAPREGAAFIFSGSRDRRLAPSWLRVRGKTGSWYGAAGTSAGDVNGDGFLDFIVAAPSWDTETGINVGQVELFLNTRKR